MAISKVIFNGVTQMDVTQDTVTPNTLVSPETATKADGTQITGALESKTSSDLTASGATVTVPAGVYSSQASKSVGTGTATSALSISATGATVSTGTNTLTLSKSVSNTPRITTAGYISSGTAGNSSVSLTASITTKAAATITPTTSNQTIASGTYLTGIQTITGDTNLTAANIKKDISIFGVTGSYEGSGGGTPTLKMGVVRPDAELVQTWSDDYLVHTDKSVTIPTYSTTSTTLVAAAAQTTKPTLTTASYRYYVLERFLTIPQYSISTKGAGRQEYHWSSYCYEIVYLPASSVQALVDTTKYTSRNNVVFSAGAQIRQLYWSSATALSLYTSTTYGVAQVVTAPSVSSGTSASPTITVTAPSCTIRGSSTYLSETYYNAITDIRCQYIIELYRVPLDTTSTYGIDGWGIYSQTGHILDCIQSSTHKLT